MFMPQRASRLLWLVQILYIDLADLAAPAIYDVDTGGGGALDIALHVLDMPALARRHCPITTTSCQRLDPQIRFPAPCIANRHHHKAAGH